MERVRRIGPVLLVVLGAAIALAPALDGEFLPWDDEKNFQHNLRYRGLAPEHLRWMWTHAHMGHYVPLTWMTLGLDHLLWKMDSRGYHATSLLLHGANAALFYLLGAAVLRRASPALPAAAIRAGAATAALIHAVHPTRVESVAWISERKDVLCGLFLLLAAHAYVRAVTRGRFPWASLAAMAAAVLSKGLAVAFPVALLALDGAVLGRLPGAPWTWHRGPSARALLRNVPFVLLALASGAATVASARHVMSPLGRVGAGARVASAAHALSFHVEKLVWPAHLPIIEPLPTQLALTEPRFALRAVAVLLIAAVAALAARRVPAAAWALLTYGAFVLPVSGLLQAGPQLVAVRYGYLATMPILLLVGGGIAHGLAGKGRRAWALWTFALLAVAVPLTWATRAEARVWHDGRALWTAAIGRNPESAVAHHGLAIVLHRERRYAEALATIDAALALHRGHPDLLNLGALVRAAAPDEALRDPVRALAMAHEARGKTASPWIRFTLAVALSATGDFPGAIREARAARADAASQDISALVAEIDRVLPGLEKGRPYVLPR